MEQGTILGLINDYLVGDSRELAVRNTMDEEFEIVGVYIEDECLVLIVE